MDRREFIACAASAAAIASAPQAFAQMGGVFLDHAVPGVGSTVSGSPRELKLCFTRGVIATSSSVQVTSSTGAAIPASKPVNAVDTPTITTVKRMSVP